MAENSFFFPGTTIGDAGPYAASTMYRVLAQLARAGNAESLAALYDMGVFYAVANQLEPTINGANIDVDTGASLVDGAYHENDATVSVPITASGVGVERIDLIVVRKNYQTAVTYTPAGGAPTVGPQTSRITVIRGAEAGTPVAPTVTQDTTRTTYWDIPLATVQVNNAGALSNLTDLREYVDAETKHFLVPGLTAMDDDFAAFNNGGNIMRGHEQGLILRDATDVSAYSSFMVPTDYITDMTVEGIVVTSVAGNVYIQNTAVWAACGGVRYDTNQDNLGRSAIAVVDDAGQFANNCVLQLDLTSPGVGSGVTINDIVSLTFRRDSNDVLDTVNAAVYFPGWIVEYFGWKK